VLANSKDLVFLDGIFIDHKIYYVVSNLVLKLKKQNMRVLVTFQLECERVILLEWHQSFL